MATVVSWKFSRSSKLPCSGLLEHRVEPDRSTALLLGSLGALPPRRLVNVVVWAPKLAALAHYRQWPITTDFVEKRVCILIEDCRWRGLILY